MRRLILAAAAALLSAFGAHGETLWIGNAQLIAATSACVNSVTVGDFFRAIYRPMGVPLGNGANSHLALLAQRSSFVMRVPNNTFRASINYVGQTVGSTIGITSKAGGILGWQESAGFGSPLVSNVTASIANFYGVTGCTGTVRMALMRLP
jgi:hypothetical protein